MTAARPRIAENQMHFSLLTLLALACLLAGCSEDVAAGPAGSGGSAGAAPDACPAGHAVGPDGACMPVGIQGCAELFIGEDGLCRPSLDKCPAGTIPRFDEGCVPVGIPGCAEVFMEEDGLCHPSMDKCPEGTFAVPTEGCVPVDGPEGCGSGTWGNIPGGPDTVWVDPSYVGGDGDGSQQKPLPTIAAALAVVPKGGRVALAAGSYDEPAVIKKPVELVGRCPSMVSIGGTTGVVGPPVIVAVIDTSDVTVRAVRIGGPGMGVGVLDARATLRRVVVQASTLSGVVVQGAGSSMTVEHSLVADTVPLPSDSTFGHGIAALVGAHATVVASAVVGNHEAGLYAVQAGSSLTVEQSLIEDTRPRPSDSTLGRGVDVEQGANAVVVASAVVGNHEQALFAAHAGTSVIVERSLIADTRPRQSDSTFGRGFELQGGASATVVASAVVRNHDLGLYAGGTGTMVTVQQSLVADTLPRENDSGGGDGIMVQKGASASLFASALARNHATGVLAMHEGTTLRVEQSLVADTLPQKTDSVAGAFGNGIFVQAGASATVVASAVVRNHEVGLAVRDPGTSATVEQSLVQDTLPLGDGSYGVGILCFDSATLSMNGSAVRASHTAGVLTGGCDATLAASIVDGVLPGRFQVFDPVTNQVLQTIDGISDGVVVAFGPVVAVGSTAALTNLRVTGCARAGFVFDSSGGLLSGVSTGGARYGLVVQGEPKPDWSDPLNVFDATELSILTDGDLPVPGPPPIPEE